MQRIDKQAVNDNENLPAGWKKVKIGEVVENLKKTEPKGSTPYLEISDIDIYSKLYNIKKKPAPSSCLYAQKNDILISKVRPTRGAASLVIDNSLFVSPALLVLRAQNSNFLFYIVSQGEFFKYLGLLETGTTYPSVSDEDILQYEFLLPPLPEQEKIAEILETVDNAIEKTDKIIEKYKRMKQGLMQELFTKGIDSNWQIRSEKTHQFKDSPLGRIPADWEVKKLGEIGEIYYGEGLREKDYNDKGDSLIFGTSGVISKTCKFLSTGEAIIIPRKGNINMVYYVPIGKKFWVIDTAFYLKTRINTKYIYFFLSLFNFETLNEATGVPSLNRKNIVSILVFLPPLHEQERIASVLSQVDAVIEKETAYRDKLSHIKQGLMEDLLTGKMRVTSILENENNQY
jgi:type I restriction enzyme S subunit